MERQTLGFKPMPALTESEYAALKEGIAERGLDYPIIKIKSLPDIIIDGHSRERATKEIEAEGREIPQGAADERYQYADVTMDEAQEMSWSLNLQRRHLDATRKRELIKTKLKESPEWSDRRIAKLLGVSPTTVGAVRKSLEATVQSGRSEKRVGLDDKERTVPKKKQETAEEPKSIFGTEDPGPVLPEPKPEPGINIKPPDPLKIKPEPAPEQSVASGLAMIWHKNWSHHDPEAVARHVTRNRPNEVEAFEEVVVGMRAWLARFHKGLGGEEG